MLLQGTITYSLQRKTSTIWSNLSLMTSLSPKITMWTTSWLMRSCWHPGILTVELRASSPSGRSITWICLRMMKSKTTTSHSIRWHSQAPPFHSIFIHMSKKKSSTPLVTTLLPHQPCTPCSTLLIGWKKIQMTSVLSMWAVLTFYPIFSKRRPACSNGSRDYPLCTSLVKHIQWIIKPRRFYNCRVTDFMTFLGKCRAMLGPNCTWKKQEKTSLCKFHSGSSKRTCHQSIDYSISSLRRSSVPTRHDRFWSCAGSFAQTCTNIMQQNKVS